MTFASLITSGAVPVGSLAVKNEKTMFLSFVFTRCGLLSTDFEEQEGKFKTNAAERVN
jgi:hypothetical protein